MRVQAENFGAEFMLAEVLNLDLKDDIKTIHTTRGEVKAFGVLLATGAHPRKVGFIGEEEFKGRGVAYCATCDGEFFTGKDVFVVGGGFAAAEEGNFLTKFARKVTILVRGEDFTCAKSVSDHVRSNPKVEVLTNTVVEEVKGKVGLDYIRYKNLKTGEVVEFNAKNGEDFGVFVFAGYVPATNLVDGIAELNEQKYIVTDKSQKTSIDGLYAAGDVCIKPLRQVVTATADGALAATELEKYVAMLHEKTNIRPKLVEKKVVTKEEVSEVKKQKGLFTPEMIAQLNTVFSRMEKPLVLELHLDNRSVSKELEAYMDELAKLTDKLSLVKKFEENSEVPFVKVLTSDSLDSGLAFHGVPGGHEFTSFILGLYNVSGPGQKIDDKVLEDIKLLDKKLDIKVLVSLSCTMCPELVVATQKIASLNNNISAHVYDINHFADLKNRYKVMSVPCLIINDSHVTFGKKNINQVVDILKGEI
jgi:thioredoxin reductase (NADPH)